MNLPSIKQLNYLLAVHQEQNFNRAAEACHISQSTLSVAITNLEELLNIQLIERDNRNLLFTPMGEKVVEQARVIVDETYNLMNVASSGTDIMSGELRLGSIPTIAPFLLGRLSKAIRKSYPKLNLRLVEDTTEHLMDQLEHGIIDVAILALPVETGAFHVMEVFSDKFQLVAHKKDPTSFSKMKSVDDLPNGKLMLMEKEHCLRGHAISACQLSNTDKIHPFEASSLTTLMAMLEDGECVSLLPELAIKNGLLKRTSLMSMDVAFVNAERKIGLIWRKTSYRAQSYRLLGGLVQDVLSDG